MDGKYQETKERLVDMLSQIVFDGYSKEFKVSQVPTKERLSAAKDLAKLIGAYEDDKAQVSSDPFFDFGKNSV